MTDKATELLEAAKAVLPHLKASTDRTRPDYDKMTCGEISAHLKKDIETSPMRLPAAERLRREADEIDARDEAIIRFRKAIAEFK